jgi:hypothetical protein
MLNLTRAVPLPVVPYPRMPSSISSAMTCGICCGLLSVTVVTPAYMLLFHTSKEWGMIQCNEVIASLPFQITSRLSLMKLLGIHDLQPQTVMVDTSCLYSSLDAASQLLCCFEYNVLLLRLHRQGQDQI